MTASVDQVAPIWMDSEGAHAIIPTTWDSGDLIMLVLSSITPVQTAPSGWTVGPNVNGAGTTSAGAVYLYTYYKQLVAADLGTTVTAAIPTTSGTSGGLLRIIGLGNTPIDVSATATTTGGGSGASTFTGPSVTTTAANELVVSIFGVDTSQTNAVLSSSTTEVLSTTYGTGYNAALVTVLTQASAGASPAVTASTANSNPATWASVVIAFTSGAEGGNTTGTGSIGTLVANHLLDSMLGSSHATWVDNNVYVGLSSTAPKPDGSNITESTATGYAGVTVANTDMNWPVASNGKKANGTDIQFPLIGTPWGTLPFFFVRSSTSGMYLCSGVINQAPVFSTGTPLFSAGQLAIVL